MSTSQSHFFDVYRKNDAPWDIGGPQGALKCLAEVGTIDGDVLDVGCGTGENALFLADCGHDVWGVDIVPAAIAEARNKAWLRGVKVTFKVGDALFLDQLGRTFDTVLDSGLFHVFSDESRPQFVRSLERVLQPGGRYILLCFSENEPGEYGPRRVTQQEIRVAFDQGWTVESIHPAIYETTIHEDDTGGARAWVAVIQRDAEQ